MELEKALEIANEVVDKLRPHCTLINIAGSCRRQKKEVKDIEIVALPKYVQKVSMDLFTDVDPLTSTIISPDYVAAYNKLGTLLKGSAQGKYSQFLLPEGIKLDLFTPDDFDYYRIFAMRTGSADYSAREIASGWKAIGWCGTDDGLRKIDECKKQAGKWKCIVANPQLPPQWKSEQEFFEWLGIKWTEPCNRGY